MTQISLPLHYPAKRVPFYLEAELKEPLTEEKLKRFGVKDQFQIFFPETGERIIAEIIHAHLANTDGGQELQVEFQNTYFLPEGESPAKVPVNSYDGALTQNLFVAEEEDGYMQVANVPGEQILLFCKPNHRSYVAIS